MSAECFCPNPSCRKRFKVPTAKAGKRVKCTACGQTFVATDSATTEAAPVATPATAAVTTLGRFVVGEKLGAGAFGTVYRAYDPQLDREVALKVPNAGVMTDPKRAERFLREAKAAANLRHPHIVPVFDAGQDGENYFIASAFIDGKPLADTIEERGTDFARAARIVRELAEALAYAHEQGIVHRDVKPQNVLVDAQDRVHLMDFGLAARHDEAARLTNDGAVLGTPAYMAPEQAAGQKGEAQPAADQYAAGVVLYELLTWQTPFTGPPAVIIAAVLSTEPEPPSKYRPDVPKDLETICLKAMAKSPEDRYANCQELAADLRRWLEGEPIAARAIVFRERVVRWVKREPKLAGAIALVALILLVSIGLVSAVAQRADEARQQAEIEAAAARVAERKSDEERKKAEALSVFPERWAIQNAFEYGDKASDILELVPAERRGWEWRYVKKVRDKAINNPATLWVELPVDAGGLTAFNHDGTRIIIAEDKTARIWNTKSAKDEAQLLFTLNHTDRVTSVAFSPVGSWVVTACGDHLARVWDATSGTQLHTLKGHSDVVNSASFSPDGFRIVTGSVDQTAKVWDARTGTELLTLRSVRSRGSPLKSASFNPDGSRVVTVGFGYARVWDATNGTELRCLGGDCRGVSLAAFSSDGVRVVIVCEDDAARVWDVGSGTQLLTLKDKYISSAAFSPDGARIVTTSRDVARVWHATEGVSLLSWDESNVSSAAWSSDGSKLFLRSYSRLSIRDGGLPTRTPKP
jgi:eukaryotic-like serine/threonine-protein kinase